MRTGRSPSYLVSTPYSYCFRIKIPKDLQPAIGKKELRYSLGTGILSDAKIKSRYLAGQFQRLFRGIPDMKLTKEQISQLIKDYKDRLFENYDRPVIHDPKHPLSREFEFQWTSQYREWLLDSLATGDFTGKGIPDWHGGNTSTQGIADSLIKLRGDKTPKGSPEYLELCQGILKAEISGIDHYHNKLTGVFDTGPANKTVQPPLPPVTAPTSQGPLLSEFTEKFPETKPKWDKSSLSAYGTAAKVMLKILGDIPVGTITRSMLVSYRETLAKSPAFWTSRHTKIKVKDLPAPGLPTIGRSTFERNLVYVGQLMDYAVDCGYLNDSPMPKTGMSLPEPDNDVHQFSDEQVKTILAAIKGHKDHRYWIPLIGLYSGCRANEICQLHKEDLKEQGGIWYLDINDAGKKTLKNKASKRLVPLHSALIELSFVEYVKSVKHHRIFPACKYRESTGKYANNFGQWFNRLLVSTGIKQKGDRTITFHSFRHRAYTTLKRLGIDNEHIDRIIGHALSDTRNETYHHGYELKTLKTDIDRIQDHRSLFKD